MKINIKCVLKWDETESHGPLGEIETVISAPLYPRRLGHHGAIEIGFIILIIIDAWFMFAPNSRGITKFLVGPKCLTVELLLYKCPLTAIEAVGAM